MSFLSCVLTPIDAAPLAPAWLLPGERARLDGLGSPARRRSFLAGRWQARCLAAPHLNAEPSAVDLDIDAQGRSSVMGEPALHLSISHTGDWVACALADAPVGIDIERLIPRSDLKSLAPIVHSPAQCHALSGLASEARLLSFYRWWTLKEAWLKRHGKGLDFALMRSLEYANCAGEDAAMDAASYALPEHGLVLALDSPALAGAPLLNLGGLRLKPDWRLKSPAFAVD